jgi:hypothetical protein
MAIPIKNAPVLEGKDARNFEKLIEKSPTQKVSKAEFTRVKTLVEKVMSKMK